MFTVQNSIFIPIYLHYKSTIRGYTAGDKSLLTSKVSKMIILQIQYFGVRVQKGKILGPNMPIFPRACVLENESYKLAYEKGKF